MSLIKLTNGVWILNSYFKAFGCKGSIRMTVLQTAESLLLHSPVRLGEPEVRAINRLGDVHAIIAPNLFHHKFLRDCASIFPSARLLMPEGLEAKIGPVPGAEVMGPGLRFPSEIAHLTVDWHRYLKETLLFHRPSRTLVTADLLYNYHREQHLGERIFFRLIGCYGAPKVAFYHRFSIREKVAVREMVGWVESLQPRRIIMSHGRIVEGDDASALFARAWAPFT